MLQVLFYLSEVPPSDPGDDLYNQMDRTVKRDFRRVLRIRGAMPKEDSVIVLMAKIAMDKTVYHRALLGIDRDKDLVPDEDLNFLDLLYN